MIKLSSPWNTYYKEVKALFKRDPEVYVDYNEDGRIQIKVNNTEKAIAIRQLLPIKKTFGNVSIAIDVIDGTMETVTPSKNLTDIVEQAFKGNEAVRDIDVNMDIFNNIVIYVIFKAEVVQFFNDDITDMYGNCNTLYQHIANDIINIDSATYPDTVFFCTELIKE